MFTVNRRTLLSKLLGAICISPFLNYSAAAQSRAPATLGAIRWDAWYDPEDGAIAHKAEQALGPHEYHYRMPFFGRETGPDSVQINGDRQDVMDEEIKAASDAGLNYWAFVHYAGKDPLNNGLDLYLSSPLRNKMPFGLIVSLESDIPYFEADTKRIIELILEPGYFEVLGNRPLLYVLSTSDEQLTRAGGIDRAAAWIQTVREQVQRQGKANPYIALSQGNPARALYLSKRLGVDANGLYATPMGQFGGAPYSALVQTTEANWDTLAATGLQIVPNIMTGWDNRPRQRDSHFWDKVPETVSRLDHYYQQGTPHEIAQHVIDAIKWIANHPSASPANTALIYAWDECDEGYGALVPTFDPANPAGDRSRIKALAAALAAERAAHH